MPVGWDVVSTFRITGCITSIDAMFTVHEQRIDYKFRATLRFADILQDVINRNVDGYVDIEEIDDNELYP